MSREIPVTNEIVMFFHCAQCMEKLPAGKSPREWASLEVGFTPIGMQVWCKRHECNVAHIDFEGHKHPAALIWAKVRTTPQIGGMRHGRN